ncbi:hypothetical protein JCM11641_008411 [Rhodosporidiobolus odoratus]
MATPTHKLALTAATATLSTAALAYALHSYNRSSPTSPLAPTNCDTNTAKSDGKDSKKMKSQKKRDKDADKPYETKREHYSASTGRWELDEIESSGSDSDEGTAEGKEGKKKRKKKMLFTAMERIWPKSAEYEGYEDYISLTPHSLALKKLLRNPRAVPGLKECEAVFEDEPEIDVRELFRVLDHLKRYLNGDGGKEDKKQEGREEEVEGEVEVEERGLEIGEVEMTEEERKVEKEQLRVLVEYLEGMFAPIKAKLNRLLNPSPTESSSTSATTPSSSSIPTPHPSALISFDLLFYLFPPRSLAVATHELSGEKYAFRIRSTDYRMTREGMAFCVSGVAVSWNGDKFVRGGVDEKVVKFKSLRRLSSLSIQPLALDSKLHTTLTERGQLYVGLSSDALVECGGIRFLNYKGVLMQLVCDGMSRRVVKTRAEGRAVVDVKSYKRMNPSSSGMWDDDDDDDPPSYSLYASALDPFFPRPSSLPSLGSTCLPPSDLCLLPPTIPGFSLLQRDWGELSVTDFSPIEFRENAWDQLVLDRETKELVKGLVENNEAVRRARGRGKGKKRREGEEGPEGEGEEVEERKVVTDIVDGKGGGLVIALHGLPGTGKTLTAEAVAETLQVPLYTIGAGSLGVHADVLEKRLRDVLDIAQQWGATLLIDEADVFLEARQRTDVSRNAMVSVFLRMLEHHSGVLFLTTNRIRSIDEAFLSRFSLAITYPNLDAPKRKIIWRQFLELAGVGIASSSCSSASPSPSPTPIPSLPNGHAAENEKVVESGKGARFDSYVGVAYLDKLAKEQGINGRQIKNIVRTAQSLALSHRTPLGKAQIDVVLKANKNFQRDFEEADERGVYEAQGEGWKDRTNIFN